jgi:PBSX family phage portal protein
MTKLSVETVSRSVSVVKDDAPELPVVDKVRFVKAREETGEVDAFKTPASELKNYDGTSAQFRRRTTTKLNKVRANRDNTAGSKIVETKDFVNGYGAFDVVEPPYNLDYLTQLYEISAPHRAAVDAKVANIVALGYKFVETRKAKRSMENITSEAKLKKLRRTLDEHRDDLLELVETFNQEDTFTETLVKVWKDYETTGNGYIEISRKKDNTIGYVGHIPAKTLRIRKKRDGFVQISGFKAQFFANFGAGVDEDGNKQSINNPVGSDRPNEVIHLKRYSPASNLYGIPEIVSAKNAVAGNEFAARFNLDYFENKAIPRHLIILKGATLGNNAEAALLQFFETGLKGQNHRSLYVPLPPDTAENKVELKIEAIEATTQDSSFTTYRESNNAEIFMVHRTPETKVSISGSTASLAIAKDADKTFKEQVCAPEQNMLAQKLKRVFDEFTDSFEIKFVEMTLTDEDTQAQIDERDIKAGIKVANEVRAQRGLPSIEGGDERVDLNAKTKDAAAAARDGETPRARDSARTAGATDSKGNARNPKGEGRTTS